MDEEKTTSLDARRAELAEHHNRVSEIEAAMAFSLDGHLDELYDRCRHHFASIRRHMRYYYHGRELLPPARELVQYFDADANPIAGGGADEDIYAMLTRAAALDADGFLVERPGSATAYYKRAAGTVGGYFLSSPDAFCAWAGMPLPKPAASAGDMRGDRG